MRNSMKVIWIAALSVLVIGYFIGQGLTPDNYSFFLSRRIPKVLAICLAAIAISASSMVFQTITNNRILTPSILGFDFLYIMLQTLIVVVFGSASFLIINQKINFFVCVLLMTGLSTLLFSLYFRRRNTNVFTLLLLGIVLGSLFSNISNFFAMLIDPNEFTVIQNAMFASFNNVNSELVYWCVPILMLCLLYLLGLSPQLDVMWLGEDNARSLGVDTRKLTLQVMLVVSVMISISTALVGPVLFFGLIVVSLTREIFQTYHHKSLILISSLMAVLLLISGQYFVEKVLRFETTVSVLINFVGGSYFLYLLTRNKI
ncbi:iron chelate uptake ABC transporter family permease subunit [Photobacterium galatheae]|uniref:ABC transporter permease n=1 Tax=Photobacterium galatheae TaxID=1654360 RepID=A0A066RN11_9GAMM|nr:iron chelate uptake ABC transporter family permease subunit [Photobacterium galatheae]KDM91714.1 ABC transporter permease [Photobacterium galatheae]MCM0149825.1 iron chelate uptake ABC transporter family permease subunit [Photobacterium galatheae]